MKHTCKLLLIVLLISACKRREVDYVVKIHFQTLNEEDIYNSDKVSDVLFDAEEQNTDSLAIKSRQMFLKGVDEFRNKKHNFIAISYFKKSILIFPEAKTYYELGNVLMDQPNGASEAIKAYKVAESLHFQPIANVHLNLAKAYVQLSNLEKKEGYYWEAMSNLQQAFREGFSDTTVAVNDEGIHQIMVAPDFKKFMTDLEAGGLKADEIGAFSLYKKSFPVIFQPFEIPVEMVAMSDYKESISYDFSPFVPEMQNTSFGRDVSNDFFYVAKVAETPEYTAVIYSSVSFWGEEMQPVFTRLVTYDPKGKIIASQVFACNCTAEKIKAGKIENNIITTSEYQRNWEQPIDKVPFDENKVKSYQLLSTTKFKISDDGKISEESSAYINTKKSTIAFNQNDK